MTIFKKSLLTLGLAATGFAAVLVIAVLAFMNVLYYETNARGLEHTAKTLFSLVDRERVTEYFTARGTANGGQVPPLLLAAQGPYRLTLIDRAGDVLWDSHIAGPLVNHLDREEVQAALAGREGSARRDSLSTGMRQIYAALPVPDAQGRVIGVFRLSVTVPGFWRRIAPAAPPFLVLAAVLALAACAAIFAFSRSLAASVGRLVAIAESIRLPAAATARPGPQEEPLSAAGEALELLSLERALRDMAGELTLRIEQARSEGRRLGAILNGMSEAVFAADSELTLHLVNPAARTLFNLGDGDVQGRSLLAATRSTELEAAARTALAEGRSLETELSLHCEAERRFHLFASPLAPAGETMADNAAMAHNGVVLVMADITRLVRLEQVRKDFVANVSHELRTPIQLIQGFSETLLDSLPDDTEQIRHFIRIIHKNAGTMENLTTDLLTLASLENGGAHPHGMEEQPLAPLFAEAVSSLEAVARKKQIEIVIHCPSDLRATVHGSSIIQALINLLDNGIKYSPEQSRVWASAVEEAAAVVLTVRDQGIGIPARHQERIFERFYRIDRARARADGTGLGLSIVRHIALLHKGTSGVESRAGEGSTFWIRIPVQ